MAIEKRALGVNFINDMAQVILWAPFAESISILIEADQYKVPFEKDQFGYWTVSTNKLKPGDIYQFLVNEQKILPDPASLAQPKGVHGPSEAINLYDFQWTDKNWQNIPLKEYIIYELHTGTFTPAGDFAGIERRLDYLKELGINAIEIMPIAQFPGERNWGYDGVFPFAVQNSYGGVKGLQKLVDSCHQKGLAVIIDVVYNHLGPEGNYLGEFGPYFTEKYKTPWGNAINFDDAWCDGVRQYFIENALMWFRDFHIDALRLDAVHAIKDFSPVHILKDIKLHVTRLMEYTGRKHYLIAELDLNDPRYINSIEKDGYGMDAQWIDEFHHALRVTSGGETIGYYADFNGINHLGKVYKDAYVYDGMYSPHRKKTFGTKTNNPGSQFVVFSQNHDQVGNRMLGERTSQLVSFEMQKLLAGAVIVSPYLPMLFMGEEWGEPNPFLYFVSHTDPELAEAVRNGRRAEFTAFHTEGEAPDPMNEATFIQSRLQWPLLKQEPHKTLHNYYRKLISLRKTNPILNDPDRKCMQVETNEIDKIIQLRRWNETHEVLCLMNFSKRAHQMALEEDKNYSKLLDSSDEIWKGPKAFIDKVSSEIKIFGESIIILQKAFIH